MDKAEIKFRLKYLFFDILEAKWTLFIGFFIIPNTFILIEGSDLTFTKWFNFNIQMALFLFSFFMVGIIWTLFRKNPNRISELQGCILFMLAAVIFGILCLLT